MSGRYTFTAGNTLTASQLNTNVMDGIPYKMIAGIWNVTGNQAVTFPVSFSAGVAPVLVLGMSANAASTGNIVAHTAVSNTGCTINVWVSSTLALSTTSKPVNYVAVQMTSSSGSGNS
jgi:hypothetical protein